MKTNGVAKATGSRKTLPIKDAIGAELRRPGKSEALAKKLVEMAAAGDRGALRIIADLLIAGWASGR